MAGDEILMGPTSALGPVDAQILFQGKRFSADPFWRDLTPSRKPSVADRPGKHKQSLFTWNIYLVH
jgi:hypothetical protein